MMFDGYFTQQDDVLENKLGITDPAEMKQAEAAIVGKECPSAPTRSYKIHQSERWTTPI